MTTNSNTIFYVSISIVNMLTGDNELCKEDFICCIFMNNDPIYKLRLDPNSIAIIPIESTHDKIELIFKKADKPEIFGCISFSTQVFIEHIGNKISKWYIFIIISLISIINVGSHCLIHQMMMIMMEILRKMMKNIQKL